MTSYTNDQPFLLVFDTYSTYKLLVKIDLQFDYTLMDSHYFNKESDITLLCPKYRSELMHLSYFQTKSRTITTTNCIYVMK